MLIASWTTLAAFLMRIIIELVIIEKKYKIIFNYKKLLLYLFIIINPVILYLGDENISFIKFIFKLLYLTVIVKLLLNKEVAQKIRGILSKIKNRLRPGK